MSDAAFKSAYAIHTLWRECVSQKMAREIWDAAIAATQEKSPCGVERKSYIQLATEIMAKVPNIFCVAQVHAVAEAIAAAEAAERERCIRVIASNLLPDPTVYNNNFMAEVANQIVASGQTSALAEAIRQAREDERRRIVITISEFKQAAIGNRLAYETISRIEEAILALEDK